MDEYSQRLVKSANNITNYFGKTIKGVWGSSQMDSGKKDGKKQTMRIHKSLA